MKGVNSLQETLQESGFQPAKVGLPQLAVAGFPKI
jgi:hypothetical protein